MARKRVKITIKYKDKFGGTSYKTRWGWQNVPDKKTSSSSGNSNSGITRDSSGNIQPVFSTAPKPKTTTTSKSGGSSGTVVLTPKIVDRRTGKVVQESKRISSGVSNLGKSQNVLDLRNIKTFHTDTKKGIRTTTITNPSTAKLQMNKYRSDIRSSLGKVSNVLTDRDIDKITMGLNTQSRLTQFDKIRLDKNLNVFQKEDKLRQLAGISEPEILTKIQKDKIFKDSILEFGSPNKNITDINKINTPLTKIVGGINKEYIKIQNKPVNKRTIKEMALLGIYGSSGFILSTIDQLPTVIKSNIDMLLSPIESIKGIYKITTNKNIRNKFQNQLSRSANEINKGNIISMGTLLAEIVSDKGLGKLGSRTYSFTKKNIFSKLKVNDLLFTSDKIDDLKLKLKEIENIKTKTRLDLQDIKNIRTQIKIFEYSKKITRQIDDIIPPKKKIEFKIVDNKIRKINNNIDNLIKKKKKYLKLK